MIDTSPPSNSNKRLEEILLGMKSSFEKELELLKTELEHIKKEQQSMNPRTPGATSLIEGSDASKANGTTPTCEPIVVQKPIARKKKVKKVKAPKKTVEKRDNLVVKEAVNHEHTPPFNYEKLTANPKGK